jgi:hypothetical protein
MQGAQKRRIEAKLQRTHRSRWTFYEAINHDQDKERAKK